MKQLLYYLPRALTVLIVAFFALFILEGFSPEFHWQDSLSHFVLAAVVLLISIIAWKKPKIGGWFFLLPGTYFLVTTITKETWWVSLPIALPIILTGVLFLIEGFRKNKRG